MIRKYQEGDLESLIDVWFQSSSIAHPFLSDDFMEREKKNIEELYLPNTETWVYTENNKLVGFISMRKNEIGGLFVLPDIQSKGIGKKLVDYVRTKYDNLEVEVFEKNSIGRKFYDKYGFFLIRKYQHEATSQQVLRLKLKGQVKQG